ILQSLCVDSIAAVRFRYDTPTSTTPDVHSFPTRRSSDLHLSKIHRRSSRRLQFSGEPADHISLHRIRGEGNRLKALAGRAFKYAPFDSSLAGKDAHQHHSVFACRDRKSTRLNSSHT